MHLVVAQDQVLEGIYVGDVLDLFAVTFDDVADDGLDVFAFDEFEEVEAGGVEEVVAGHGFVDDVEDEVEGVVVGELGVVEGVVEADEGAEEFQCHCRRLVWECILSGSLGWRT